MSTYIQLTTTTETREAAGVLAEILIEQKLAACVQISGPITSVYSWKGAVTHAEEWTLTLKTRSDLFLEIETAIKANHTYELPEIIATNLSFVSQEYAKWMEEQLTIVREI